DGLEQKESISAFVVPRLFVRDTPPGRNVHSLKVQPSLVEYLTTFADDLVLNFMNNVLLKHSRRPIDVVFCDQLLDNAENRLGDGFGFCINQIAWFDWFSHLSSPMK